MDRSTLSRALWISLVSTGLLFAIELAFAGSFPLGVPWAVFVYLSVISFIAATSIIEGLSREPKNKIVRVGSILTGVFAVAAWTIMFIDQLPCFFGGKGC